MAEMGRVSRFFVNRLNGRRTARAYTRIAPRLQLPRDAACLEIGCGNADMARRIVEGLRPARYVATDLDPQQIEAARMHLMERGATALPPHLELREADMLALPFPDGAFDAVLAFQSLHHADAHHGAFANVPKALAEVDRVLRPGGRFGYSEFLNTEKVRAWLEGRGYRVEILARRWRAETVLATKGTAATEIPLGP